ncbi:MAG: DUF1178 family protein [Proteobacteria bacterium]|nr:DUF1178 family protein [Pseudomonadota bacterium]
MIVFDLFCQPGGHRFEGWFASSGEFVRQQGLGLVVCPHCGSARVEKAPMAPAVGRKGNQAIAAAPVPAASAPAAPGATVVGGPLPPGAGEIMAKLAAMQAEALRQSTWVGDAFAEQSRAMHYGERDAETIHGQATLEEARDLLEEGVALLPLPFPVAPPDELN